MGETKIPGTAQTTNVQRPPGDSRETAAGKQAPPPRRPATAQTTTGRPLGGHPDGKVQKTEGSVTFSRKDHPKGTDDKLDSESQKSAGPNPKFTPKPTALAAPSTDRPRPKSAPSVLSKPRQGQAQPVQDAKTGPLEAWGDPSMERIKWPPETVHSSVAFDPIGKTTNLSDGTKIEILEFIGSGGFGDVYKGVDSQGNQYAIKFPKGGAVDKQTKEEFLSEIDPWQKVQEGGGHPNICQLFGTAQVDGVPCIVSELVNGPPLADAIKMVRQSGIKQEEQEQLFLAWTHQFLSGIAAIHQSGLVHFDIKPENILLDLDTMQLKIIDFGLTKKPQPAGANDGGFAGTPAYVAPEVLTDQGSSDRSDMWSVGKLLADMFLGPEGRRALLGFQGASEGTQVEGLQEAFRTHELTEMLKEFDRNASYDRQQITRDNSIGLSEINPGRTPSEIATQQFERNLLENRGLTPQNASPEVAELIRRSLMMFEDERSSAKAVLEAPIFQQLPSDEELKEIYDRALKFTVFENAYVLLKKLAGDLPAHDAKTHMETLWRVQRDVADLLYATWFHDDVPTNPTQQQVQECLAPLHEVIAYVASGPEDPKKEQEELMNDLKKLEEDILKAGVPEKPPA